MSTVRINDDTVRALVGDLFVALGASRAAADLLADSLVSADLEGVASHGVMLVPMYVDRVRQGSVKLSTVPTIIEDLGALAVMDASHGLGQVSALAATDLAIARARAHGVAIVAVRHAFHFGAAAYWGRRMATQGMVGIAMSNTRPLMPAPGGAERVIGNNPLAFAFPSDSGNPLVVDMAMSATAMGKIRLAEAQGRPILEGWATDALGQPTTSAAEAIKGMLLPAAGPKGFGLAVAVELLCSALSGGAIASSVQPLYGNLDKPYDCSHTFVAIDAARLHNGHGITSEVAALAEAISGSRKAPGTDRIYAPGDLERARRAASAGQCELSIELAVNLNDLAKQAGIATRLSF